VINLIRVAMVLALVAVATGRADAQTGTYSGFVTGQAGVTSGGDMPDSVFTPGLSVAVQEVSGWGAELDFGFANGSKSADRELDLGTYMVNAFWQARHGRVRPYGVGGVGVIQVHGCFNFCTEVDTVYDLGINLGGGVLFALNDIVGLRGDARYFWAPGEKTGTTRPGNYAFWRVSVGVTFMWAITP